MKILLLTENFPPRTGGSGRWFWEIYSRLPRECAVIAAGEHPRQEEFDAGHQLNVVRLPLSLSEWGLLSLRGLSGYAGMVRHVRRLIRQEDVRMLHCGRCLPEGITALALRSLAGIPYLCFVHGEDVATARDSREHTWLVRRVLHSATLLIANSENTARILRGDWAVPEARVAVLHPGVDTRQFVPSPRDLKVRESLGWCDRPVILTVGRLQRRKGHDRLIEAMTTIRRSVPDVLYAIVGDGEERRRLEELVAEANLEEHVQFLGEIDDRVLLRCYQQCDLFVLPNRTEGRDIEGFGMVLVEAQACGKPVIAGDSGGTAETMRQGETGLLVCCDQAEPLGTTIVRLLLDPDRCREMGRLARSWVEGRFDWSVLGAEAESLFRGGASSGTSCRQVVAG